MASTKYQKIMKFFCRNSVWILAFCWISSICLGLYIGSVFDPDVYSLMRMASGFHVSIVGLVLNLLLPIVLSAAAVSYLSPRSLLLLVFGKGLCHGICMYMTLAEFSSAGWLQCRLLMFSEYCLLVPLFILWIHQLDGSSNRLKRDITNCLVAAAVAAVADYFIVSPFVVTTINHS